MEIGYNIILDQRTEGCGTESIQILMDYLFVTKELVLIQAVATRSNIVSIRALEKAGYTKEGRCVMRCGMGTDNG